MLKRVDKILIGTDIDREAALVGGYSIHDIIAHANVDIGEIIILDRNKSVIPAGATIANTDIIYIAQVTAETFTYTDRVGTAFAGSKRLRFSDPIEGAKVRSYRAEPFVVKAEKVVTLAAVTAPLVAGTEFVLRLVYKDIKEHPGQFTQTYRFTLVAGALTTTDLFNGLRTALNGHSGRRVDGTGAATLILTGREIPECCTGLTDIDKFNMVDFTVYLNYVDADGNWQAVTGAAQTLTTPLAYGSGNWEQIRDIEKAQMAHLGITNLTHFPVVSPAMSTVVDSYYDMIVIEHDKTYLAPNNQGVEQTPITTVIALATAVTGINAGTQAGLIVGALNTWMASTPGAFAAVAI